MRSILPAASPRALGRALCTSGRRPQPLSGDLSACYSSPPPDVDHMRRYVRFIDLSWKGVAPLCYWYLVAQRAQLALMMDRRFSYPVPGLVHMSNAMRQVEPIDVTQPLELAVQASQDPVESNGRLCVTLDVTIGQGGRVKVRCNSRYLGKRGSPATTQRERDDPPPTLSRQTEWAMASDIGRRYAGLSGDYNPIHLWSWSARLMGFKRPIVHGMCLVAKAQALIEAVAGSIGELTVSFVRPAPVPETIRLEYGDGVYRLSCGNTLCAVGTYASVPPPTVEIG